jgi:hypothetical protein
VRRDGFWNQGISLGVFSARAGRKISGRAIVSFRKVVEVPLREGKEPFPSPTVHETYGQAGLKNFKDLPKLLAAVYAGATHLFARDARQFGRYFGKKIDGGPIPPPAELFRACSVGAVRGFEKQVSAE